MSIYSLFIYENHFFPEHKPTWMSAERYDYCEQISEVTSRTESFQGLKKAFRSLRKSSEA
jgi:hypothetical protein